MTAQVVAPPFFSLPVSEFLHTVVQVYGTASRDLPSPVTLVEAGQSSFSLILQFTGRNSERNIKSVLQVTRKNQSVASRASYNLGEEVQSVASRASYNLQEEGQSVWQGTVQERVDSIAASPRAYLVRRPAQERY